MNANTNPETFSDWFHYMLRNKQQASALSGGLVIMIYSGQMLAWGIFNYNIQYEDEFSNAFMPTLSRLWLFWLVASWFIAAAVAAYLGAKLVENIRKIKIYIIGYSLMMISSCFFIIFSNWATMILVARIIAGISHGISFISVLVHAGEICTPKLRGMIVSSIQISIFIGVFIASLSNMQRFAVGTYQINFNLITGIIGIVLTLGGLILLYFLHIESPVYFIRKQQSQKAQTIMMKLRNEDELSDETRNDLEDIHKMFGEDFTTRDEMFEKKNIQSLTWMIILRVAFVCSFNMPLNLVWLSSIFTTIDSGEIDPSAVSLIAVRLSTLLVISIFFDCFRKTLAFVSISFSFLTLVTLTVFDILNEMTSNETLMITLAFLFQFLSALGVGIHADIYSTECFSLTKKPLLMAHTFLIELSVQVLLVLYFFYPLISFFWILILMSIHLILTTLLLIFFIPDTARLSLNEAKLLFHNK